jgi:hypothetical protein
MSITNHVTIALTCSNCGHIESSHRRIKDHKGMFSGFPVRCSEHLLPTVNACQGGKGRSKIRPINGTVHDENGF